MNVLVTGVCGHVGRAFIRKYDAVNNALIGVDRNCFPGSPGTRLAKFYQCDLVDNDRVKAICEGIDCIIHLAGEANPKAKKSSHENDSIRPSDVLFEAAAINGVKKIIFLSSNKADDESVYGSSKKQIEKALKAISGGSGLTYTILRSAMIYSPEMKGSIAKWIGLLKFRFFPALPESNTEITMIGLDDLCKVIAVCIDDSRTDNKTYNIYDGEIYNINAIERSIRKYFNHPRPLFAVSKKWMKQLARLGDNLQKLGLEFPYDSESFSMLFDNVACKDSSFEKEVGFRSSQNFYNEINNILKGRIT